MHSLTTSSGLELQVGISVATKAHVEMKAWARRPAPKVTRAMALTWISLSLVLPPAKTSWSISASCGFRLRKISDVAAYASTLPVRYIVLKYQAFGLLYFELVRSRMFELK